MSHTRTRKYLAILLATWAMQALSMGPVHADLILTFSPTIDPVQAVVGQTFSVDVILSGLNPGERLTYLGMDATTDAASFLLASNFRPAAIIRDNRAFATFSNKFGLDNIITASFESEVGRTPPLPAIESNGVFFSFDLTPIKPGTSSLDFTFVGNAGRSITGTELPQASHGPSIQFSVAAVPEPSFVGLLAGCCGWLFCRRKRQLANPRFGWRST